MNARTPCALLAIALLLATPRAVAQKSPPDAPGKSGQPAAQAPDEKALVREYDKALKTKDAATRAAAVMALGDASRALPDGGASKYMAKALARTLEDEDLEVQSAVVAQLSWGRDVETVLDALGAHVEVVRKEVERRISRPDEESKSYVNRATRLFGDTSKALANYRDDRSVEALASIIQRLRANTEGNTTSARLVGRIAEALLDLGTHDAVQACIRQTQMYTEVDGYQELAAKELHRVLAIFATRVGKAPPDFSLTWSVAWDNWFEEHGSSFPKKLGKLKQPPAQAPATMPPDAQPDDGRAAPR
ncbi:MAG: hypothetical protein FJ296_04600 [Planctomycetes bacterium]|nr:hypothetical protein [Planctomycetota bacterium]